MKRLTVSLTMDSPLFATPVARQGPTSRLLRRRSEKAPAVFGFDRMEEATPIAARTPANVSFAVPVTSRSFRADQTLVGTGPDETIGWEATRLVFLYSSCNKYITNLRLFKIILSHDHFLPQSYKARKNDFSIIFSNSIIDYYMC